MMCMCLCSTAVLSRSQLSKICVAKKYWCFIRRLCRLVVGFKGLSRRGGRNIELVGGEISFSYIYTRDIIIFYYKSAPTTHSSAVCNLANMSVYVCCIYGTGTGTGTGLEVYYRYMDERRTLLTSYDGAPKYCSWWGCLACRCN